MVLSIAKLSHRNDTSISSKWNMGIIYQCKPHISIMSHSKHNSTNQKEQASQTTKCQAKSKRQIPLASSDHNTVASSKHRTSLSILESSCESLSSLQKLQQNMRPARMVERLHWGYGAF
jgi:ribosome assembly protein YihI (activator of Der GTPase)